MSRVALLILATSFVLPGCGRKEDAGPKLSPGAAAARDDAHEQEYKKFEGTWNYAAYETAGRKLPEAGFKGNQYVFHAREYTRKEELAGLTTKGTFKLDPTKQPKTIDMTDTEGHAKGDTAPGIYELEGDTLRLCTGLGKDRPKEFAAKEDTVYLLIVLKKAKP